MRATVLEEWFQEVRNVLREMVEYTEDRKQCSEKPGKWLHRRIQKINKIIDSKIFLDIEAGKGQKDELTALKSADSNSGYRRNIVRAQ